MLPIERRNLVNVLVLVLGFAILAGLLDLRVRSSLEGQILMNRAATTQAVTDVRGDIERNRAELENNGRKLDVLLARPATEPSH